LNQYSLKLSSCKNNHKYSTVSNAKFNDAFNQKPNETPPLGIRIQPDLWAVGFLKTNILQYSRPATPPWIL